MRNRNSYSRIIQDISSWEEQTSPGEGELLSLLHHCVEQDITSFYYSEEHQAGSARSDLGTALSESGLSRDKIQLISRYSGRKEEKDLPLFVDGLLQALKTDYLDLLLLDLRNQREDDIDVIAQLYAQGKVLEIGGYDLETVPKNSGRIPVTANVVKKSLPEPEILKNLANQKVMSLVFSDKREGFLRHLAESEVLRQLNQKYNMKPNELLLRWVLQHPAHLHPVISTSEEKEITAASTAKNDDLEWSDWQKVNLILS